MREIKPCPKCGEAPTIGYACGEYFILSISKAIGTCACSSFAEMHASKEQEIEAWNRRATMVEYVERAKLISDLKELPEQKRIEYMGIYDCIRSQPTADVAEVRHGHWTRPNVPNTRSYKWQCSECGQIAYWLHYGNRGSKNIVCKFGYCPHCGAKMDGDTE